MEVCPKRKKSGCAICSSKAHKPFGYPQRRYGPPRLLQQPPTSTTTARVTIEDDNDTDNITICTLATKYSHPQSALPRSLLYRLTIQGGTIDVFVDPGSELSLISEKIVQERGINCAPLLCPVYIVFADKSRVKAYTQVTNLKITRGDWSDEVTCIVVPSLTEPIFLGRDWLKRWNPTINWISREIQLPGSSEAWLPLDKDRNTQGNSDNYDKEDIMTPSASRKCLRVACRNE